MLIIMYGGQPGRGGGGDEGTRCGWNWLMFKTKVQMSEMWTSPDTGKSGKDKRHWDPRKEKDRYATYGVLHSWWGFHSNPSPLSSRTRLGFWIQRKQASH